MKKFCFLLVAALLMGATNCGGSINDPNVYSEPKPTTPMDGGNRPGAVRDDTYQPNANQRTAGGDNNQVQITGDPSVPATTAGQYANLSFQRSGSFQDWGSAWHREPANRLVKRNRNYLEVVSSLLYSKKEVLNPEILWDAFSMSAYTVKNLHGERPVDPEKKAVKVTRNLLLLLKYVEYANEEGRGDVRLKAALEDMLEDLSFLPTQYAATVRDQRHELEGQIDKGWGFDDEVDLTHAGAEWIDAWGGSMGAVPIAHF